MRLALRKQQCWIYTHPNVQTSAAIAGERGRKVEQPKDNNRWWFTLEAGGQNNEVSKATAQEWTWEVQFWEYSCFGELECLHFPKDPCWTSCHPQQHLCILIDKFWKVLESQFFIKILLLPPSHLLLLPAAQPLFSCSAYKSSLPLCYSSTYVHVFPGLPPHCCLSPHPHFSFTIGRAEAMLAHSKEGIWKG